MKRLVCILIVLLFIGILSADTVPDFRLPDINGQDVQLSDLLGKGPILLDFWASWCNPCKTSMPYLNDLKATYDSLTVVMVSIDASRDVQRAKSYLRSKNYDFVALFDSNKTLAQQLNVTTVPHTFIIDKEGNISYVHTGFEPGNELEYAHHIRTLLGLETDAE